MRDFTRRHSIVTYVALAYALSSSYWIPLAVSGALVTPGGSAKRQAGVDSPSLRFKRSSDCSAEHSSSLSRGQARRRARAFQL